jgi:hypothetical protein
MKVSMIRHAALLAVAGAVALTGCDSVKDVREEPYTAVPAQTAVLGGTITNLGTRRPLILQNNGVDSCVQPEDPNNPSGKQIVGECRFFGVLNEEQSLFSFGALPVGTTFNITIKKQPFSKICTVNNPTGTVGGTGPVPTVTCADDPTIPRYSVTVNVAAGVRDTPGLKVILSTEEKSRAVAVNGAPTVVFSYPEDDVFDNQFGIPPSSPNLPIFGWRVTATAPGATALDPIRNCYVTGGPVTNTGGNIGDDGIATPAPTGDLTVSVNSCGFAVRVQADFSVPTNTPPAAPTTTTPPSIPSGEAVSVLLREQPSGKDVAGARITSFANTFVPFMQLDSAGAPTTTPYDAPSHRDAFYEVVVKSSPTGMACIPGASVSSSSAPTSTRAVGSWLDAGAVLLRQPASARVANLWVVDRVIRCRSLPVGASVLRGVYQQSEDRLPPPGSTTAPSLVRNHNYLAFFEDGTYLYGNHVSSASSNGVEQGFYHYNTANNTLVFTPFTDTNAANGLHVVATAGSAVGAPVQKVLTNVVKVAGNPSVITATFTAPSPAPPATQTNTAVNWILTEVGPDPLVSTVNPVDGAWVTYDPDLGQEYRQRIFVYQHGTYNAFHMGVNGVANLQEACYVGDFGLTGTWTRQGGRSGCHMRIYTLRGGETLQQLVTAYPTNCGFPAGAPVVSSCAIMSSSSSDIPNPVASLADFPGRWPQSRNPDFTDGRPYSLVEYELRLANSQPADPVCPTMDKLTVWDTQNGTRKSELTPPIPPIVLCRIVAD